MALSHRGALGDANPKVGLNAKSEQLLILNGEADIRFLGFFQSQPRKKDRVRSRVGRYPLQFLR